MNKAINIATGEYLIFLNSGDIFYTNQSIEIFCKNYDNYEIVYGNLEVKGENNYIKQYPSALSFGYFLRDTLPHPATFIKKEVFKKCGPYATDILIASDWAFFLKAICLQNISYKHLPYTISSFDTNGISSQPSNQKLIGEEKIVFLKNNFPSFYAEYLEMESIKIKFQHLKNSRIRKYLSFFFKQLQI